MNDTKINLNGTEVFDNTKYKIDSRFVFSKEEFEKIRLGLDRGLCIGSKWNIACKDDCVYILRGRKPDIVFKTEFVPVKEYFISCVSRSKYDVEGRNYQDTVYRQNYLNFWIYSIVTQLVLKHPPLMPLDTLVRRSTIDFNSIHGFSHWRSVYRFGKMLYPGIDIGVLFYFSVFHDFFRSNDQTDDGHGKKALMALTLIESNLRKWNKDKKMSKSQVERLAFAFENHDLPPVEYSTSSSALKEDKSVRICIDADRLDLERVGICPDSEYLLTTEAKKYNNNREQ